MSEPLATVEDVPDGPPIDVHSVGELTDALDAIAARCGNDRPALVTVVGRDGDSLAIGLGRTYSVLSYVAAGGRPPFSSQGDLSLDEEVVFYFGGDYSEFGRHQAIGCDQAYESMRQFVMATGLPLPENTLWEET